MSHPFEYFRPATRRKALQLLARKDMAALPLVIQPKPIDPRRQGAQAFIDLSLLGFDQVSTDPLGTLHLGSLLSLQQLIDDPQLQKCPHLLLGQAASLVATPGIRNLSTLWGAAVANSGPAEIILALLALEAQVVILGRAESRHVLSFQNFHAGLPATLHKGELLSEIILPPQGICTSSLERITRTPRDEAIVAAAALLWVEAGAITRACLAVAGAHPLPQRLPAVEKLLLGQMLTPELMEQAARLTMNSAEPAPDFRGSVEYRRSMSGLVIRRALLHAWDKAIADAERGAQ
jgi:CO/xanthine dehydrogenase FAD-binding subunit